MNVSGSAACLFLLENFLKLQRPLRPQVTSVYNKTLISYVGRAVTGTEYYSDAREQPSDVFDKF
jgi:hypothetical protein